MKRPEEEFGRRSCETFVDAKAANGLIPEPEETRQMMVGHRYRHTQVHHEESAAELRLEDLQAFRDLQAGKDKGLERRFSKCLTPGKRIETGLPQIDYPLLRRTKPF